jgi:8-oxo-dGTP pyrophosphatase MutT (NUDIX family)
MAFAAGAWVFPGGRVDEADRRLAAEDGLDPAAVAAIRETLEETALPVGLLPRMTAGDALSMQAELVAGKPFTELLRRAGLVFDAGALTPIARWVPKFHAVRRFDTLFFVASSPGDEFEPNVIEGECSQAAWFSASRLLELDAEGKARLIFPTRRNLERLAQHSSFESIRSDALAHPIEPISPWVEEHGGEQFITIPDHLGYPVTRERLQGLWRG